MKWFYLVSNVKCAASWKRLRNTGIRVYVCVCVCVCERVFASESVSARDTHLFFHLFKGLNNLDIFSLCNKKILRHMTTFSNRFLLTNKGKLLKTLNMLWVEFCYEPTLVGHWNPWLKIINTFLSQHCEQKYLPKREGEFEKIGVIHRWEREESESEISFPISRILFPFFFFWKYCFKCTNAVVVVVVVDVVKATDKNYN